MDETIAERVRAAIGDRAIWLALILEAFREALPEGEVERLARKAIFEYGRYKATKDPSPFSAKDLVLKFIDSGSAKIFDSDIEWKEDGAENRVHRCPLVDAWRGMGLDAKALDLLCDIAMEGDRGRAAAHGIEMDLQETIGRGDSFCRIGLSSNRG